MPDYLREDAESACRAAAKSRAFQAAFALAEAAWKALLSTLWSGDTQAAERLRDEWLAANRALLALR